MQVKHGIMNPVSSIDRMLKTFCHDHILQNHKFLDTNYLISVITMLHFEKNIRKMELA